jgi:hypothetical protein
VRTWDLLSERICRALTSWSNGPGQNRHPEGNSSTNWLTAQFLPRINVHTHLALSNQYVVAPAKFAPLRMSPHRPSARHHSRRVIVTGIATECSHHSTPKNPNPCSQDTRIGSLRLRSDGETAEMAFSTSSIKKWQFDAGSQLQD